jgi:hypothetical protein
MVLSDTHSPSFSSLSSVSGNRHLPHSSCRSAYRIGDGEIITAQPRFRPFGGRLRRRDLPSGSQAPANAFQLKMNAGTMNRHPAVLRGALSSHGPWDERADGGPELRPIANVNIKNFMAPNKNQTSIQIASERVAPDSGLNYIVTLRSLMSFLTSSANEVTAAVVNTAMRT